jgi:hypothetical protein
VFYVSKNGENMLDRVMQGMTHEGSFNLPLFSTYSKKGEPMLAYESMKGLLHFLQVNFFCKNIGVTMLAGPCLK